MKTLKEKTAEIRKSLKVVGITNKMVSVKGSYPGYDEKIKVTIKDLSVKIKDVEAITNKYTSYETCHASGEILEGGNTWVSVSYDYQVLHDAAELKKDEAQFILDNVKDDRYTISDTGKTVVVYYSKIDVFPEIRVMERPEGYENMDGCYCYDTKYRAIAHNVPHIAQALVHIESCL